VQGGTSGCHIRCNNGMSYHPGGGFPEVSNVSAPQQDAFPQASSSPAATSTPSTRCHRRPPSKRRRCKGSSSPASGEAEVTTQAACEVSFMDLSADCGTTDRGHAAALAGSHGSELRSSGEHALMEAAEALRMFSEALCSRP
jgi:hypothetical protein